MLTVIAVHIAAAVLSVMAGAVVFLVEKGSARHRLLGRIWVSGMFITVLSSVYIRELNPGHFSWVHGLSLLTAFSLVRAIWAIRQGNVRGHAFAMQGSLAGLVVAGIAAVATPHRLLNIVVSGWIAHGLW
ncbi:DUF2306 domain-containing protein [Caballeronia sp. SEWSISQ10-4 2]|uniref:DUF2306 domain-containing protein n=1 Tax=Caballeronia sp. SEWSISQ10-4 2 TaxID=2937438 RepID=UPI00265584BD|nr:DUF2306 domain-containing protein [Caballeronia sp. SEWSISQ10-4 2]MDN7183219.1 DUF2306 domain-containing protein [Caballeronia sp. SEWSISQ10-4 2]